MSQNIWYLRPKSIILLSGEEQESLNLKCPLMFCGGNKSLWPFTLEVEVVNIGYGQ